MNFGLIKISGSYFKEHIHELLSFIKSNHNQNIIFMVGGGNIMRGRSVKSDKRLFKDRIGIMSTLINGIDLADKISDLGFDSYIASPICNEDIINKYNPIKIRQLMQNSHNKIIICGGLGWCGNVSTDTAMVIRGLELSCNWVCKASTVGGVFDKDPSSNVGAKLLHSLDYEQAIKYDAYDKSAILIAQENNLPLIVANLTNLSKMLPMLNNNNLNDIDNKIMNKNSTIIK
ncbi:amino acid kinase family protein [Candidatus Cytomitobacter primus]|uniref:UMP kinase n=1 Tax=Candidatus Cytomitobacter primus TaxID=2066024 RepID=A0A5C0UFZ8_9PROT|nr:hypothetical protein [Candidatus Cytomitobacter primus]QEK38647.1 hypothetical protein FZC34_01855 [Candidatus Cytomitobacter primus]